MERDPTVFKLCPYAMQKCLRGDFACPLGRPTVGDDPLDFHRPAMHCIHAGDPLPPCYYRALTYTERKRGGVYTMRPERRVQHVQETATQDRP